MAVVDEDYSDGDEAVDVDDYVYDDVDVRRRRKNRLLLPEQTLYLSTS